MIDPVETGTIEIGGNLSSDAAVGESHTTSIITYDSLGEAHEVLVTFEKSAANTWTATADMDGNALTLSTNTLVFDTEGNLTTSSTISLSGYTPPGAEPIAIDIDLGSSAPIVQFGGGATAEAYDQNGNAIGFLNNFAISENGTISGQFSNGETKVLAMIATATFNNPSGLIRAGETHFQSSVNSGEPIIGEPGVRQPGPGGRRRAGDEQRRLGARVHQPDHRSARLPGQQPGDHRVGRDPQRPRQPEALIHDHHRDGPPVSTGGPLSFFDGRG